VLGVPKGPFIKDVRTKSRKMTPHPLFVLTHHKYRKIWILCTK